MANLLYKLGLLSARRAWMVITTWILILGTTVGLMAAFAGTLTTSMSINNTPSNMVIEDLKASFKEASRGSGQVLFHKTDGTAFNASDEKQIVDALTKVETFDLVDGIMNPFSTAAEIEKSKKDLADGQKKLAEAPGLLKDAQKKLDDGAKKLASGQLEINANTKKLADTAKDLKAKRAQLEAAIAQIPENAPSPYAEQRAAAVAGLAQVIAGQAKVTDGQKQLVAAQAKITKGLADLKSGQKKIDDGWAEIKTNTPKLETAARIMSAMQNFVTVSKDGQTANAQVFFEKPLNEIESATKSAVVASLQNANIPNVEVEISSELTRAMPSLLGPGELVGLLTAAIVLFVILGTFIGAGLPVLAAILGVGISASITMSLSSLIQMTATTPVLGVMLGLAVGIDYALFIINRHRRQLKMGTELRESIGLANGTSGNAVVFAGVTVIIALAALNLTGIGFLGLMGTFAAVAVAISVMVAVTFTPALLGLVGMRILSKKERSMVGYSASQEDAKQPKNATRSVFVTRHPWISIIASAALLLIVAQPVASLRLGLPDGSAESVESTQYKAFKLNSEAFGVGANGPIVVVATSDKELTDQAKLDFQANIATDLMKLDNVSAAVPAAVSDDNKKFLFQVIPATAPSTIETENLVYAIRALDADTQANYQAELGVTGFTASNIDLSKKLSDALPFYLATVLLLSLIILILVFRSLAVPLIASAGFLLTVGAVLGASVAVFQWGWFGSLFNVHDPGPIMSFVPTIIIGVVFGLAMDYQLFLVSGMREAYVHGKSAKESINFGIHLSRSVVIAAAIIMIMVFGGFAFSEMTEIRPIGFGLAAGVLLDAFLVRLILVPATMTILGNAAWYIPKWLDKLLPNVDVEGEALEREHLH